MVGLVIHSLAELGGLIGYLGNLTLREVLSELIVHLNCSHAAFAATDHGEISDEVTKRLVLTHLLLHTLSLAIQASVVSRISDIHDCRALNLSAARHWWLGVDHVILLRCRSVIILNRVS